MPEHNLVPGIGDAKREAIEVLSDDLAFWGELLRVENEGMSNEGASIAERLMGDAAERAEQLESQLAESNADLKTAKARRAMGERKFFDDTTYAEPAMFLDHATNRLWHGPTNPESNLHWGKLEGFLSTDGSPIFVYCASELPDGDYIRIEIKPPKSRDELVQELLDVIDSNFDMGKFATWKLKVLEARAALTESETSDG